jgi:hypothetical protein
MSHVVLGARVGFAEDEVVLTVPPSAEPQEIVVSLENVLSAGKARIGYHADRSVEILRRGAKRREKVPSAADTHAAHEAAVRADR